VAISKLVVIGLVEVIGSFALGALAIYLNHWTVEDLVWGIWISSLIVGLIFLYTNFWAIPFQVLQSSGEALPKARRLAASIVVAVLFSLFYTLHFGGFHLGHAMFLSSFFPLERDGVVLNLFSAQSDAELINSLKVFFKALLEIFWPLILLNFWLSRETIFGRSTPNTPGKSTKNISPMSVYVTVAKMHVLIFAMVGLKNANVVNVSIAYIVLFFFFFPLREFFYFFRQFAMNSVLRK